MLHLEFPPSPTVARSRAQEFFLGVELTRMQGGTVDPLAVARALTAAKVRYVMVGAHGVNAYTGKPRATLDVDVLTDAPAKAVKALSAAFPEMTSEDHPVVVRFKLDGQEAIDVMKALTNPLFRRVVRMGEKIDLDGEVVVVPKYEAVLAMKFASMIGPARQIRDKYQDARDFITVADQPRTPDAALLHELGELVYAGGGAELLKLVDDARAGRRLEF